MKRLLVIQDHHAKRAGHHWDIRFESSNEESADKYKMRRQHETPEPLCFGEGERVLRSFCIPKHRFPSPGEKLLAIQTEDHPWDYRNFSGVIPDGSYGQGRVDLLFCDEIDVPIFEKYRIVFNHDSVHYIMYYVEGIHNWLIQRKGRSMR